MAPNHFRLFLVAGEVSGDVYGADLVTALRRLRPDLTLIGVGGRRMEAAGMRRFLDSEEWGVIGWLEVLPRVPAFLRRLSQVVRAIDATAPAAVVLIDFPGFNLPLARRIRPRVTSAYFMPPMVSTRRGDRAHRIARLGLRLLATFPFEADAYRRAGADVLFIGHPALDRVRPSASPSELRRRLGILPGDLLVALLPGSRHQEVHRHLPLMVEALAELGRHHPRLRAVLPVAASAFRPLIDRYVAPSAVPVTLVEGGRQEGYDALAASDFAAVASGTATLEAMCLGVPMVVIYRLPRLTWWYARRFVAAVSTAALPSLLAGRPVVPELLQDALTPAALASTISTWLADERARAASSAELLALRDRLGDGGAVQRAAEEILRLAFPAAAATDLSQSRHSGMTAAPGRPGA